ncbi:MAG: YhjD/YihY/BrkB family envelope integrity protein [Planctomycetota bacterium]
MSAETSTESKTSLRDTIRVVRVAVRGIYRSRLPQMAAALAFRTLFALIPILFLSVAIIGAFADRENVEDFLDTALVELNLDIAIAEPAPADEDGDADVLAQSKLWQPPVWQGPPDAADVAVAEDESAQQSIKDILNRLIENLLAIQFKAIGAVGLLTLIYAAFSMLTEIERAFNHVYRAKAGRSWVRRITQYWTTLTLGALIIFGTFYISGEFKGLGAGGPALGYIFSIAIGALFFLLAYMTLPNTRVHVRAAVVGGLVAAVLWEGAKWGFREYVSYSVSYSKLYGSLGILPLFMLWIYLSWLIVLFGLQVSFGLQHIGAARELAEQDEAEEVLTEPAAVIPLLVVMGENFARGKPTEVGDLADEVGIPAVTADSIVEQLASAGVVHKLDGGDDRYTLAKPPGDIEIAGVLAEAQRLVRTQAGGEQTFGDALSRLREAEREALEGVTLKDLLSDAARRRTESGVGT